MAETIRGITIQIGADTTALGTALRDVNRQSSSLQSELRQVQRLLQLDPGNTDLVAQRQRLLADSVTNTTQRLNTLRTAQAQVDQQLARGEINEGQYRAFQREVAAAEAELRRLRGELDDTGRASRNLGEQLSAAAEKMKDVGEKMMVAITAPIVAAGGLITKGVMDSQAATGKLKAQLGTTSAEAKNLTKVAKNIWKTGFGENIEEVTDAVKNVRLNMKNLSEKEFQSVAAGAMTIASVFDADVTESTAAARVMMENFGISGTHAMDLITAGFQKGGDFSGELLDTLREYSPQFSSMGMSADQMFSVLIAGAEAGAWNLDKVGDAVKEFNIRAQDGSKTTASGFAAIGLNAQQMGSAIAEGGEAGQQAFVATLAALAEIKDATKQDAAGVALFGTQWEDLRANVVLAMQGGMDSLNSFDGAMAQVTKDITDSNPAMALTASLRELQDSIAPALEPLVDILDNKITPAIKNAATAFSEMSKEDQNNVVVGAGIAAAVPLVLTFTAKMIECIKTISGPLKAFGGLIAGATAALAGLFGMATAPFLAMVAAIIAGCYGTYKGFQQLEIISQRLAAATLEAWPKMKATICGCAAAITDKVSNMFSTVGMENFAAKLDGVRDKLYEIMGLQLQVNNEPAKPKAPVKKTVDDGSSYAGWLAIKREDDIIQSAATAEAKRLKEIANETKNWSSGLNSVAGAAKETGKSMADSIKEATDSMLKDIDNFASISTAKFDVMRARMGDNSVELTLAKEKDPLKPEYLISYEQETKELAIDLQELQQQLTDNVAKINALAMAYENAKSSLGEYHETTLDYQHQMELAMLAQDKLYAGIKANTHAQKAAAIKLAKDKLEAAQKGYDGVVSVAKDAKDKEEDYYKATYDAAKENYDNIVSAAKDAYDATVNAAAKARDSQITILQGQLNAIDEAEAQRSRDGEKQDLEDNVKKAKGKKKRAEAEAALAEWQRKEDIRLQKEAIQTQIDAANNQYNQTEKMAKDRQDAVVSAANSELAAEKRKYENALAATKSYYNSALSAATDYYQKLGYQIDAVTGKLSKMQSTAQNASGAVAGAGSGNASNSGDPGSSASRTPYKTIDTATADVVNRNGNFWGSGDFWRSLGYSVTWDQSTKQMTVAGQVMRTTVSADGKGWAPIREYFENYGREVEFKDGKIFVYGTGTDYHPGGPAIVGEEREELIVRPDGSAFLSPGCATVMDLEKGTRVFPHSETEDILKNRSYSSGVGNLDFSGLSALLLNALNKLTLSIPALSPAVLAGVGGPTQDINLSFNFTGPLAIRDDADIKTVSREIFNLAQSSWRSKGVR